MRKQTIHSATGLLALLAMTAGCAITNYPVIDDHDQTNSSVGLHTVNTSGEAFIAPEIQVATIWPDGSDNLHTWVNQGANGNQTLLTRNNFCDYGNEPCTAFPFAGLTYLNPESSGCWIWRAPNPAVDDTSDFDGSFNDNCSGARSLKILLSTSARLQEGGKDAQAGRGGSGGGSSTSQLFVGGLSIGDVIGALGQLDAVGVYGDHTAEYGLEGWKVTITPDNLDLSMNGTRFMLDGVVFVLDVRNRSAIIDARTGNVADMLNQLADFVDANGNQATLSVAFAGVTPSFDVGLMDSDHYRALADRAAN